MVSFISIICKTVQNVVGILYMLHTDLCVSYLKFFPYLNERYCVNLVSVCVIILEVNSSFIYTS